MAAYDEDSVLRRGRGRPVEAGARRHMAKVRLDDDDMNRLRYIEDVTGDNTSDIFRIALRGYYMYLREGGKIK